MGCELPVRRLRRDRLMHVATRVLGTEERARAWIREPHAAFDGQKPEDLVDTLEGLTRVIAELESGGLS